MTESRLPKRLPKVSRRRIWTSLIVAGLALVIGILALVIWFERQAQSIHRAGQESTARLVASGLANAVYGDMVTRDFGRIESSLMHAMTNENLSSVMLVDSSGKVLAHVRRKDGSGQPMAVYAPAALRFPTEFSHLHIDGQNVEYWTEIGQPVRAGALRVQLKLSDYDAALLGLQVQMSSILMGTGAALILILGLMLRQTYVLFEARESGLLQVQRHLTSVAYRDALTGLPNRLLLREQLDRLITESDEQNNGFAVCFLDLDEFKAINDQYGHDAGDQLLIQVAQRLENSLRQSDIAFRLGGDEFVVVLSNVRRIDQARHILDRIMATAQQPARWKNQDLHFGISMGVALYPSDAATAQDLLSRADRAMYAAKRSGKSRWLTSSAQENFFA